MRRQASVPGRYIPPQADPKDEDQAEKDARQLASDVEELRSLKAEDIAAKHRGEEEKRPELARRINELVRAIDQARGGQLG